MKELVRYLLENMYLDFQGEISLDTVRQFLRTDDSREARQLLQKLIEDKGVDELLLTLADCLKDHLRTRRNEEVVREQLAALLGELIGPSGLAAVAAAATLGALSAGCDAGKARDVAYGVGAPVHIAGANVSETQPLVVTQPIEIAFDRLLAPSCITRQTFVLQDLSGNFIEVAPAYDPVARVVRLCLTDSPDLQADQTYRLTLVAPQNAEDTNGVHAIDGAGLDPGTSPVIEFQVVSGPVYTGPDACVGQPAVDFCGQVLPIFANKCSGGSCHSGSYPAAGLLMTTAAGIQATAIARAAQGDSTGDIAKAEPPGRGFAVDMPIIDPTAPSDSWLTYKLLLAPPPATGATDAGDDGGATGATGDRYPTLSPAWTPLSDDERATLANYVLGREMPYPVDPGADPASSLDRPHGRRARRREHLDLPGRGHPGELRVATPRRGCARPASPRRGARRRACRGPRASRPRRRAWRSRG